MKNKAVLRHFTDHGQRTAIRADFPEVVYARDHDTLAATIKNELAKIGHDENSIGHINIAFPQKHPDTHHYNKAAKTAAELAKTVQALFPQIEVRIINGIYEHHHLNRTDNQSMTHTLINRQRFSIDGDLQTEPATFLTSADRTTQDEVFLLSDKIFYQGTTLAQLLNYIEQNGGYVIGASVSKFGNRTKHLAQQSAERSNVTIFDSFTYNKGRIPALAMAFERSAKHSALWNMPRRQLLEAFDYAFAAHGHSLEALTDGEALELIDALTIQNDRGFNRLPVTYCSLLQDLVDQAPSKPQAQSAKAPLLIVR